MTPIIHGVNDCKNKNISCKKGVYSAEYTPRFYPDDDYGSVESGQRRHIQSAGIGGQHILHQLDALQKTLIVIRRLHMNVLNMVLFQHVD